MMTYLSKQELKIIYKLLEHQYISYENHEAIRLVKKIHKILEEKDDMVIGDSQSTPRV